MHQSSLDKMDHFIANYLHDRRGGSLDILDIGSQDVTGSYRRLFDDDHWNYTGLDVDSGPNVHYVANSPYQWKGLDTARYDVIISGQTLEHVEFFWLTMLEIERVLKPGGLCCLIVPSSGFIHRYPVDCWRFYPDGLQAMARYAHLEPLETNVQEEQTGYPDWSDVWTDATLIAQKPLRSALHRARIALRRRALQWASFL